MTMTRKPKRQLGASDAKYDASLIVPPQPEPSKPAPRSYAEKLAAKREMLAKLDPTLLQPALAFAHEYPFNGQSFLLHGTWEMAEYGRRYGWEPIAGTGLNATITVLDDGEIVSTGMDERLFD